MSNLEVVLLQLILLALFSQSLWREGTVNTEVEPRFVKVVCLFLGDEVVNIDEAISERCTIDSPTSTSEVDPSRVRSSNCKAARKNISRSRKLVATKRTSWWESGNSELLWIWIALLISFKWLWVWWAESKLLKWLWIKLLLLGSAISKNAWFTEPSIDLTL